MIYFKNTLDFFLEQNSVITLGKFDGLHRGHELLMDKLKEKKADSGYLTVVFTFDIPPQKEITGESSKVLTTNEEKEMIFEDAGVDCLIECPFVPSVMTMEPEDFIKWIVERLNVKAIVVGDDFCFGHNRSGNYQTLKAFENKYGYTTIVVKKIKDGERDISSTYIREEISAGNIAKANKLLGYSFFIRSLIVHGNKIGRTIGIPTINMILDKDKLLPPYGVYITRVLVGERWYAGVTNVGCKPTIKGDNPVGVETYIIDFCQDIYDKVVTVQFIEFIRPEMKFSSIDELKQQMNNDIAKTIKYYRDITEIC